MQKILGLDLGTNSIGWAIRNTSLTENQLEKFGVITFEKGVGEEKGVEYSFAAERTKHRSSRRRYQAHKYKLWATLGILIRNDYCPLSEDSLNKWKRYEKGIGRQYPINDLAFNKWIKLDFNGDGVPDYKSPYQLRFELASQKLDFASQENRYKLGRALYHIAQHRAFKSSKKIKDGENISAEDDFIGAEKKRSQFIEELIEKHKVQTVGAAFALEERSGQRIRKELHQHVLRKQLQNEIKYIFDFQQLSFVELLGKEVDKSCIFWQRPLRSQKGAIGLCTLEQYVKVDKTTGKSIIKGKIRCPVSHPAFEEFRALSFINSIEYREINGDKSHWCKLPFELRQEILREKFYRTSDFDFIEIRKFIEKKVGVNKREFNYRDKTNISACIISARLKDIFGANWKEIKISHPPHQKRSCKKEYYDINDIWHVLFSYEDEDEVRYFASEKICLTDKVEKFVTLWYKMPVAYGMLSLNAINKILRYLQKGFIYTEAVLLAKMPEILGEEFWRKNEQNIISSIGQLIDANRKEKWSLSIANNLIANYKALENRLKFAERNFEYKLQEDDLNGVRQACIEKHGSKSWQDEPEEERNRIFSEVAASYQSFFNDPTRAYKKLPHLQDSLKSILADTFILDKKKLDKLYHPSQIDIYPPAKERFYEEYNKNLRLLGSPKNGALKNPMAMRTLYELRKLVNHLLVTEQIDESTHVVVEVAREMNDANMRWAIETYQRRRQEENKEFALAIAELLGEHPQIKASPNSNVDVDKFRLWFEQLEDSMVNEGKTEYAKHDWGQTRSKVYKQVASAKELILKYRLWKEQECQCMYTGKFISIVDLFSENSTDFEHTVPRSICFDNSLANLTVCDFVYNRSIKKNRIPTDLENYSEDVVINNMRYTAIKPRLEKWEKKIEELKNNIEFWKKKSRQAATKEAKDKAIRQKHLWQFELNYWHNKLNRFTITEIKSGFKNSQLVDTQIISKYAYHYLKAAFNRVEVQKGSITAEFRKIYGVQPNDVVKDRSKHSHHAKDAAVLTLIPTAAKREQILKNAYEYEEQFRRQYTELPYQGFRQFFIDAIDNVILINNIAKEQALTPSGRRVRVRGAKVFLKKNDGTKVEKWSGGDSIRGQLHLETFYGKIKVVKRSSDGKPLKNEHGNWIYEEKNDGFAYAVRQEVNKDLKIESIIDPDIKDIFYKQMNGRSLDKTIKEDDGIYMINRKGDKVGKIRHVRCFASDVTEPLPIKRQTYLSKKEYKNMYWAKNGENYAYALYEGVIKNKVERDFKLVNLFDASKLIHISETHTLNVEPEVIKRGHMLPLRTILKVGQKVVFYKDDPNELFDLDNKELSKRMYKIIKFEKDGRIVFGYHLSAQSDPELKTLESKYTKSIYNGFSIINYEQPWPKLKLSIGNFNFMIEKKDFELLPDGTLNFKQ